MCDFKGALLMNVKDNVATALSPINENTKAAIVHNGERIAEITAINNIEAYHKIALRPIEKGELVYKYGEVIGIATNSIQTGEHVHVNNIESVMGK